MRRDTLRNILTMGMEQAGKSTVMTSMSDVICCSIEHSGTIKYMLSAPVMVSITSRVTSLVVQSTYRIAAGNKDYQYTLRGEVICFAPHPLLEKGLILFRKQQTGNHKSCLLNPFQKVLGVEKRNTRYYKSRLPSRNYIYIILTTLNPLLYSKTGVYMGIHYFSYFCSKT